MEKLFDHPLYRRFGSFVRGEAPVLAAVAIIGGLVLAFLGVAELVHEGEIEAFDHAVLAMFHQGNAAGGIAATGWFAEMVRDITALGSFVLLTLIFIGVVGYLWMARIRGAAILVAVSVLGGSLLSNLLKAGYNRPRPDIAYAAEQFTASFPSGHALLSAVTYLTLGALLARFAPSRRLRYFSLGAAIFITLIVGLSRLYLGVHYPSDVIAGWSLGAAWALLCSTVALVMQRRGTVETPTDEKEVGPTR
ncbi:phosphatase PAP2 family protein [Arsenicitalea aurantiaca]|uniref:phosphatase PAP2 family protein n=1 Tax=Arsenicitalea aurantiaca TaxID=1783274 RepID=UPI00131533B9|nr:phosphatase PAP2 family protein [Arsenicitalea aurantiaca]